MWRESIGRPLYDCMSQEYRIHSRTSKAPSCSSTPSPRSSPYPLPLSPQSSSEPIDNITLSRILNETKCGNLLSAYYENKHNFGEEQRSTLINSIAQFFHNNNIHLKLSKSYMLEKEIIERFPSEKLVSML